VSRSRHLKLDTEYGFERFVKERDFYPERQTPPQTPAMMRSWPRRPKWTTTPAASPVIRYVLAPVSVTLALALSRMFLYFHWPQPFTALALSAIAISFWYGSTTSGIIATLIALLVRNSFFQPETSIMARALYDLAFLVFALLMIRVTRDQNQLETKVVEQNADLAHANEVLKREELKSRMLIGNYIVESLTLNHFLSLPLRLSLRILRFAAFVFGFGLYANTTSVIWSSSGGVFIASEP